MTGRLGLLALLALAVVAFLGIVAQPAAARSEYVHGGADCTSCHGNNGPTNANCTQSGCHNNATTPFDARGGRTCWACHTPGQDMSGVQTNPGCGNGAAGAACHNTATPHLGSNLKGCTNCHGVALSYNNPDGSAHHNNVAYAAPTCTDCHDGTKAVAPHGPYTADTCQTCHVGVSPTHPTAAQMVTPTLTVLTTPSVPKAGDSVVVSGKLMKGTTPVAGAALLLQTAPTGTTSFAQLGGTVTTGTDGSFSFPAATSDGATIYRVIAHGIVLNTTVLRPVKAAPSVKPALTIGLSKTSILLGRSVTVKGTIKPTHAVKVTVQKKVSGSWKTLTTKSATVTVGATSTTYKLAYKPLKRGAYRVQAVSPATTGFLKATSAWKTFKVT